MTDEYTAYVQSLQPGDEVWLKSDSTLTRPATVEKARVKKVFKHVVRIGYWSFAVKPSRDIAIGRGTTWNWSRIILPTEADKILEETKAGVRITEQRGAFAERARRIMDALPGYKISVNTKADMQAVIDNLRQAVNAFEALMRDTPDEVWRDER